MTAIEFIAKKEYIGSYAGRIVLTNPEEPAKPEYAEEKSSKTKKRSRDNKGKEELDDDDVILYDEDGEENDGGGQENDEENSEDEDIGSWNPYQITPSDKDNYYVDGEEIGNEMRYINDSKGIGTLEPNVGFFQSRRKRRGYLMTEIYAIRDIEAGEEILASYGDGYWKSLNIWYKKKNPYKCPNCDYRTDNKYYLRAHLLREKASYDLYQCDYCDNTFKTKSRLKQHTNIHIHEVIYECDYNNCNYETLTRASLVAHKLIHNNKRWKCLECGIFTSSSGDLNYHIRVVHRKEKPFKCEQCKRDYPTLAILKQHKLAVHDKIRPYVCHYDNCDFKTARKEYLKEHARRKHSKGRSQFCDICGHASFSANAIRAHKLIKHRNNQSNEDTSSNTDNSDKHKKRKQNTVEEEDEDLEFNDISEMELESVGDDEEYDDEFFTQ